MRCVVIILIAMTLTMTTASIAQEYSFGDWAIDNGLAIDANEANSSAGGITNLAGLNAYTKLERIYLSYNQLTAIAVGDFAGMTNLKWLYLDNNQINSIAPASFADLTKLHTLKLGSNQISSISAELFSGLGNLRVLQLLFNNITTIDADSFNGLGDIQELWLGNNQLTEITAGTFRGLGKLETLKLLANPIVQLDLSGVYFYPLTSFMVGNTDIVKVDLSRSLLSQDAYAALIDGLDDIATITEFTLANANLSAVDMPGALSRMDYVTKLDLTDVIWSGAVIAGNYDYVVNIINNLKQDKLTELAIDVFLYTARQDFFDSWAAGSGNTLIVSGCLYELAGDVNGDCVCDWQDFAILAKNWLVDCNETATDPACISLQ